LHGHANEVMDDLLLLVQQPQYHHDTLIMALFLVLQYSVISLVPTPNLIIQHESGKEPHIHLVLPMRLQPKIGLGMEQIGFF
jgi:hypothetical protein